MHAKALASYIFCETNEMISDFNVIILYPSLNPLLLLMTVVKFNVVDMIQGMPEDQRSDERQDEKCFLIFIAQILYFSSGN